MGAGSLLEIRIILMNKDSSLIRDLHIGTNIALLLIL